MSQVVTGPVLERHELLEGVTYERREGSVVLRMATAWQALSSAVLWGGRRHARSLLHLEVPKTYRCDSPGRDLRAAARELGLAGPTIGLMTAVDLAETQLLAGSAEGVALRALITVGLGNLGRPRGGAATGPGTINVIVVCGRKVAESAAVELAMLVAEAKAAALMEAGVRTPDGALASGTSTDGIAILWHRSGREEFRHAGSATELGNTAGQIVTDAVVRALRGNAVAMR
ncbi:MAG: adenosylcobinamide amidohydrolase [Candidatus Limnocylindrales bacterium]